MMVSGTTASTPTIMCSRRIHWENTPYRIRKGTSPLNARKRKTPEARRRCFRLRGTSFILAPLFGGLMGQHASIRAAAPARTKVTRKRDGYHRDDVWLCVN